MPDGERVTKDCLDHANEQVDVETPDWSGRGPRKIGMLILGQLATLITTNKISWTASEACHPVALTDDILQEHPQKYGHSDDTRYNRNPVGAVKG